MFKEINPIISVVRVKKLISSGIKFLEKGEFEKALLEFGNVVTINKNDLELWNKKGVELTSM